MGDRLDTSDKVALAVGGLSVALGVGSYWYSKTRRYQDAMMTSEFLDRYSSGTFRWKDVSGEVSELVEEIESGNWSGSKEEAWDVLMTFQLWLTSQSKIDYPITIPRRHIAKFERRRRAWENIFKQAGLEFSPRYLIHGSNYHKPEKVQKALEMARKANTP